MENIILDQQTQSFPQEPQNLSFEPAQPNKEKNIYKILFFISTFVFLAIIIALYFVLNNKTNKLSSKESVENNQTQIEEKTDSVDNVVLEYENVSFSLPENSSVFLDPNHYVNKNAEGMGAAYTVQINNSKYEVIFNNPSGIPECSGKEIDCIVEEISDIKNIEVFKIWRSNESFVMLNPTLIDGDISATIKNISNPNKSTFTTDEIEMWKNIFSNSVQKTVTDNSELKKTVDSLLINKDVNNNLYTNNKFGFSLTVPKKIKVPNCEKTNGSYSLSTEEEGDVISVTFFDDVDTIYFTPNYFYKVTGLNTTSDGYHVYTGCQKVESTLDSVKKDLSYNTSALNIYIENAKNINEIKEIVKIKYGEGCSLEEKIIGKPNYLILTIKGDGRSLGDTKCHGNGLEIIYKQANNFIMIFNGNQALSQFDNVFSSLKFN